MGWPKRRPEGGRVAAPARRAAESCPDGASASGAASPFRALSPVAADLDADADVAEIAAAMRGLVRERVAELQAERGRGRRRGASGRMAAEIAPLARVLEQVLRIQNAYRTRETGDDGTHARRSLAELRDELYRRLVGDAGPGDGPGVCRGADAG
jgi:hypothetical protein